MLDQNPQVGAEVKLEVGFELDGEHFYSRIDVEIVTGVRIGLTKAVDLPWRYGLRGSKFLSKPFAE